MVTLTGEFAVRAFNGVHMFPGMVSEKPLVWEAFMAKRAAQVLVMGGGRVGLAVQVVLEFGVVREVHATARTSYHFLMKVSSAVLKHLVPVSTRKLAS